MQSSIPDFGPRQQIQNDQASAQARKIQSPKTNVDLGYHCHKQYKSDNFCINSVWGTRGTNITS